mmetsp:Transcript_5542/g.15553  ORF Transcript_5542/g.15553 Transcript_5542/m.15553 type:complete len:355 (+) Transcript_5542:57-1121(+)
MTEACVEVDALGPGGAEFRELLRPTLQAEMHDFKRWMCCRRRFVGAAVVGLAAGTLAATLAFTACSNLVLAASPRNAASYVASAAIPLITVETRLANTTLPMTGVVGRVRKNVGVGLQWHGFLTKATALLAAAQNMSTADPERIIILFDRDIMDGGCSDRDLLDRYNRIVQASDGAPVVVGADVHQYPAFPAAQERFMGTFWQQRRRRVMAEFGMNLHVFDQHEVKENWRLTSYSFVNSGFIMGPAGKVAVVMQCIVELGRVDKYYDDQFGLTKCAARNPQLITLDYTSGLVLTAFYMKPDIVGITPTGIQNRVFGGMQCFVHLNGNRDPHAKDWVDWFLHLPKFQRAVPLAAC